LLGGAATAGAAKSPRYAYLVAATQIA
jgi:hypothetical protein